MWELAPRYPRDCLYVQVQARVSHDTIFAFRIHAVAPFFARLLRMEILKVIDLMVGAERVCLLAPLLHSPLTT